MTDAEGDVTVERLVLKPDWLDRSDGGQRNLFHFYTTYLGIIGLLLVMLISAAPGFQQLVITVLIIWLSMGIVYAVGRDIKGIKSWRRERESNPIANLPLKRTSKIMERALKGKVLSQILIEKRLRSIIMEKIKDAESLSDDEAHTIVNNPSALREFIDDEDISEFLLNSKNLKTGEVIRKKDERKLDTEEGEVEEEIEKEESYEENIKKVIDKISEWRTNKR